MKATGIVRRIDDLGRVVIPKEIRRTMRIREGDPSHTTLTPIDRFCMAIHTVLRKKTGTVKFTVPVFVIICGNYFSRQLYFCSKRSEKMPTS